VGLFSAVFNIILHQIMAHHGFLDSV
jgi:hypothetical protein